MKIYEHFSMDPFYFNSLKKKLIAHTWHKFWLLSYAQTLLPPHNHTHNNQPYPIHTQYQTCETSQQYKLTKNQD
jgi:hypothetical protein